MRKSMPIRAHTPMEAVKAQLEAARITGYHIASGHSDGDHPVSVIVVFRCDADRDWAGLPQSIGGTPVLARVAT